MELSGHSPFIVFDDVDLDSVTDMAISAKFRNNGQVCISPSRFYVHENKKKLTHNFVHKLIHNLSTILYTAKQERNPRKTREV